MENDKQAHENFP